MMNEKLFSSRIFCGCHHSPDDGQQSDVGKFAHKAWNERWRNARYKLVESPLKAKQGKHEQKLIRHSNQKVLVFFFRAIFNLEP